MTTKLFKPAEYRTKTFQFFMYGFCLTFTANLSKKIHAKNLKIFFKKLFLKKTCFGGTENVGFFGGRNSQEKMFRSQKKASVHFDAR